MFFSAKTRATILNIISAHDFPYCISFLFLIPLNTYIYIFTTPLLWEPLGPTEEPYRKSKTKNIYPHFVKILLRVQSFRDGRHSFSCHFGLLALRKDSCIFARKTKNTRLGDLKENRYMKMLYFSFR